MNVGSELAASNEMRMESMRRMAVLLLAVHSAAAVQEDSRRGQSANEVSPVVPPWQIYRAHQGKEVPQAACGRDGSSHGYNG